ncbi:MAG: alpha/beta hydrolase, partial [Clostridia bacterium]|nr:alpha/beta hydrolase [Clostridia bacterium]
MKNFFNEHKKRLIAIALALATLVTVFAVYVGVYYRADGEAVSAYVDASGVEVTEAAGYYAVGNENAKRGFVFYPGGKVEAKAYLPLAIALAKEGIFTVVVKMPCNLAVFGINSASRVIKEYDSVEKWFVGGHSLGGSMAASYAKKHQDKVEGVIL